MTDHNRPLTLTGFSRYIQQLRYQWSNACALPVQGTSQYIATGPHPRFSNGNRLAELGVDMAKGEAELAVRDGVARTEEENWQVVMLKEKQRVLAQTLTFGWARGVFARARHRRMKHACNRRTRYELAITSE